MPPYRILSLDGGGCRAIIESTLLRRLLTDNPTLLDEVDLFTGASAGGILALCFAAGFTNEQTATFYETDVKNVFIHSILREFETFDAVVGTHYDNDNLKEMLTKQFGNMKMGDLKRKVLIPSFQLDNASIAKPSQGVGRRWVPRFFHNVNSSDSNNELVVDVALRTSAAPTYFPIYQGYVDGGVFANNPALCAITNAIASGINIQDIVVLSLSTGKDGLYIDEKKIGSGNWGLIEWAPHLVDLLLDSSVEVIDYQCAQLLGPRYQRVDPPLPKPIALDQPAELPTLIKLAEAVDLRQTQQWLKDVWKVGSDKQEEAQDKPVLQTTPTTQPGVPQTGLLQSATSAIYGSVASCNIM
eukprot:TRINITY_DN1194_c0_g1_i1.p1 TRINITY_DN1194_c0_g1~~TRINITY_DN1194_c0_g1_i1.p1  ORF type:complete len:356 (+),score=107.47 TRINITY_DN1194_c0_g1_i1:75-1142(+)